jgi:diketogulonate reductase-like aldo/keto reductase
MDPRGSAGDACDVDRGRRRALRVLAGSAVAAALAPRTHAAEAGGVLTRPIPSSGEALPVVGLGSWITFNVGNDRVARDACTEVMRAFFAAGGRMIDSSPMYGSSQDVIGEGLERLGQPATVFAADKVWIGSGTRGPAQMEKSRQLWRVPRFDLLQVHNLLAWEEHLPRLFAMKAAGQVRYVGITTSEGRRHADVERIMRAHPVDFVQVSYNVADREVEARILPLARERGIAVIVNRPFREGALQRTVERRRLPPVAADVGAASWAELILKFIVSHPAVTCVIPATTRVDHVRENVGAARGPLPSEALRRRIDEQVQRGE